MKYISTRSKAMPLTFSEAIGQGLASDGGLFVPAAFPLVNINETPDIFLSPFLENDPLQPRLKEILADSLNFPIPLRFRDHDAVLELFHGPTAAFKDVGARFLAACISRMKSNSTRTVIVATSGDTGGAVGGAFVGHDNIEVIILFPKGKISQRQEKQIACWGQNVHAFAVHGTFDDCQKIVKEALSDKAWSKEKQFVSANSISVGRLLPQMIYYAHSSLKYVEKKNVNPNYVIPTGNLGNAVACLWAKRIGFPIGEVVLATNANHTIGDFFENGDWKPNPTIATLANAMDVGNPSNMERLRALYPSHKDMKRDVQVLSVSDAEISEEIRTSVRETGDVFCPHTATALAVQKKLGVKNSIIVATAHPAKFETIVEPLIGRKIPVPSALAVLLNRESEYIEIEPTLAALKNHLR